MPDTQRLSDLFTVAERFHRSVNIALDSLRASSLAGYILTPLNQAILSRVYAGLAPRLGNKSWSLTGPYGAGKSACVLFMAQVLRYPVQPEPRSMLRAEAPSLYRQVLETLDAADSGFIIVPMVGSRQPLTLTVLAALDEALQPFAESPGARALGARVQLLRGKAAQGEAVAPTHVAEAVEQMAALLQRQEPRIRGLLLILDELGRSLEFAALYPEHGNIELLQTLAEFASRSQAPIIGVLTVLHQAFEHYAAFLTPTQQREWNKVKGRFEDIGFLGSPGELLNLLSLFST